MKFSYTALNTDNQQLTGVLDSGSIENAQQELHKMGLSIISITPISEEEFERLKSVKKETRAEGIQTFSFEASDPTGKTINGTIDARDAYSAYKRLVTEYKFKINDLYLSDADEKQKADSKSKLDEWASKLSEEGYVVSAIGGVKGEMEGESEIDKQIVGEIDRFIVNAKKVIKEHSDKFTSLFLQQIDKTLGELERVRTSNNIKHICEISNELFELISHPDNLPPEGAEPDKTYQNTLDSMKGSGLIRGDFDAYAKAVGLGKIKSIFSGIKKMFGLKEKPRLERQFEEKTKSPIILFLRKLIRKSPAKKKIEKQAPKTGFALVIKVFFAYIAAPNAILRQARKQELKEVYRAWKTSKPIKTKGKGAAAISATGKEALAGQLEEEAEAEGKESRWNLSPIFAEIDSFIAWLLFFYIFYFFLVDFSLEKDIGLPRDFIIKTLKTPLILNITIFLLFTHFILKMKSGYFRNNIIGSAFLIFFGLGLYLMIIINF
jgi:hypothetical protein